MPNDTAVRDLQHRQPLQRGISRSVSWKRIGSSAGDIFAFLAPALQFIEVNLVGRLFLTEILLFIALPLLLAKRGKDLNIKNSKRFLLLSIIWLSGQIVTDFIVASPFDDLSRGWSRIIFMIINFLSIFLLTYKNQRRLILFALGLLLGGLLEYFDPGARIYITDELVGKFIISPALMEAAALLASIPQIARISLLPETILILTASYCFTDLRSMSAMMILSAVSLVLQRWLVHRQRVARIPLTLKTKLIVILFLGISSYGVFQAYTFAATEGYLGTRDTKKFVSQSESSGGILLGGRSEILISSIAIMESPIIGHGSWAKDARLASLYRALERENGIQQTGFGNDTLIPSHSEIFGAWVDAGILGLPFWIWVEVFAGVTLVTLIGTPNPLTAYIALNALATLWNVPFSPFGAQMRFTTPFTIILFIYVAENAEVFRRQTKERLSVRRERLAACNAAIDTSPANHILS